VPGEPDALGAHPFFKRVNQRHAPFLPRRQPLPGSQAVDLTLDLEQRVDAFDRLKRHRRDWRSILSSSRI